MRLIAAALVLPLAACLSEEDRTVRASDFGDAWPFTVSEGRVNCFKAGHTLTFAPSSAVSYALTGGARADGYADITPIWRDDPNIPGAKVNLQPITEAARKQC